MKPTEAKMIADKKNKPLIEKFWVKNPLEDFFYKTIKDASEKGEYHFDFVMYARDYNVAVAKEVYHKLSQLGYVVEVEASDKIKTEKEEEVEGWLIRIKWD